ncbi:MAG TPA: divalent-cation tolerance protein CutA [Propionibacteriaceae bacterium]|nr:divalent-cation tolerance protein CutA [Propionibacteriaceae bacterium]
MTEPICEVIITADDENWLINFSRSVVKDRLAACGQHISPIRSIYRWDGSIHDDREVRVALHTRASLVPSIVNRVNRQHPYQVPCVLALPVQTGNPDYLTWVIEETIAPSGDDQV